jgi:hypothetical protein
VISTVLPPSDRDAGTKMPTVQPSAAAECKSDNAIQCLPLQKKNLADSESPVE